MLGDLSWREKLWLFAVAIYAQFACVFGVFVWATKGFYYATFWVTPVICVGGALGMMWTHQYNLRQIGIHKRPNVGVTVFLGLLHAGALQGILYLVVSGSFMNIGIGMLLSLVFTVAKGFGVHLGNHVLFTHSGFKCRGKWIPMILAYFAALAFQITKGWRSNHLWHHKYTDTNNDPHSPYKPRKSLSWAHMGWIMFYPDVPTGFGRIRNVELSGVIEWQKQYFPIMAFSGFFIPWLLASWEGFFLACGNAVYVLHAICSVNSLGHWHGNKVEGASEEDKSRNSWIVGLLTLWIGEHDHANHHWEPHVARWSLQDFSWKLLLHLERKGYVYDVKRSQRPNLAA